MADSGDFIPVKSKRKDNKMPSWTEMPGEERKFCAYHSNCKYVGQEDELQHRNEYYHIVSSRQAGDSRFYCKYVINKSNDDDHVCTRRFDPEHHKKYHHDKTWYISQHPNDNKPKPSITPINLENVIQNKEPENSPRGNFTNPYGFKVSLAEINETPVSKVNEIQVNEEQMNQDNQPKINKIKKYMEFKLFKKSFKYKMDGSKKSDEEILFDYNNYINFISRVNSEMQLMLSFTNNYES